MHYSLIKLILQSLFLSARSLKRFLASGILSFFLVYSSSAISDPLTCNLSGRQGYMLVMLHGMKINATIVYDRYSSRNSSMKHKTYFVTKEDLDNQFILLPINKGDYQILSVDVPLFDLPYKVGTKDRKSWRFKIEKGKVNYIGELHVSEKRTKNSVNTYLVDRLAKNIEVINNRFKDLLAVCPLAYGGAQRNDFWQEIVTDNT